MYENKLKQPFYTKIVKIWMKKIMNDYIFNDVFALQAENFRNWTI